MAHQGYGTPGDMDELLRQTRTYNRLFPGDEQFWERYRREEDEKLRARPFELNAEPGINIPSWSPPVGPENIPYSPPHPDIPIEPRGLLAGLNMRVPGQSGFISEVIPHTEIPAYTGFKGLSQDYGDSSSVYGDFSPVMGMLPDMAGDQPVYNQSVVTDNPNRPYVDPISKHTLMPDVSQTLPEDTLRSMLDSRQPRAWGPVPSDGIVPIGTRQEEAASPDVIPGDASPAVTGQYGSTQNYGDFSPLMGTLVDTLNDPVRQQDISSPFGATFTKASTPSDSTQDAYDSSLQDILEEHSGFFIDFTQDNYSGGLYSPEGIYLNAYADEVRDDVVDALSKFDKKDRRGFVQNAASKLAAGFGTNTEAMAGMLMPEGLVPDEVTATSATVNPTEMGGGLGGHTNIDNLYGYLTKDIVTPEQAIAATPFLPSFTGTDSVFTDDEVDVAFGIKPNTYDGVGVPWGQAIRGMLTAPIDEPGQIGGRLGLGLGTTGAIAAAIAMSNRDEEVTPAGPSAADIERAKQDAINARLTQEAMARQRQQQEAARQAQAAQASAAAEAQAARGRVAAAQEVQRFMASRAYQEEGAELTPAMRDALAVGQVDTFSDIGGWAGRSPGAAIDVSDRGRGPF